MPEKLVVCLDAENMKKFAHREEKLDIAARIKSVPSLKILSGDPQIALSVEIDGQHVDELYRRVDGICTVEPDRTFSVPGRFPSRFLKATS